MTTVKSPAIFESPSVDGTEPWGDAPSEHIPGCDDSPGATQLCTSNEELTALLRTSVQHPTGRYVELDVGGLDELGIEPFLYRLLGVLDSTELLFGVAAANDGDLAYCRAEYGDPLYRVTLAPEARSALDWEIWKAPAAALWSGSLAGASLVLPAHAPGWVILTHPARGNPWLFPTHS